MEGLFIVIAIVIGILDFAAKQQKKQGSSNRQGRQRMQNPVQRQNNIPESLKKAMIELKNSLNEGMGDAVENEPVPVVTYDNEGIESEDRSRSGNLDYTETWDRSKSGSLEYVEPSDSLEGTCDEHPEHGQLVGNEKKAAPRVAAAVSKEDILLDLTADNLIKGIVMSEIFGPPRAFKRRIR